MEKILILQSKDYGMFKVSEFQRNIRKVNRLEASMRKYGWISSKPMDVIRNGGRQLVIRDGHHRFEIARRLGIPIKYVIDGSKITMEELEGGIEKWNFADYLSMWVQKGNPDYILLKDYCDTTGISIGNALSMMAGYSSGTGSKPLDSRFKRGEFLRNTNTTHAWDVADIVLCMKKYGIGFANHSLLVQAISKVAAVSGFEIGHIKQKIKAFPSVVEKKANLDQYLDMLEELYNKQSRQKIPLKFLAIEEAKKRNPVKRK